MLTNRIFPKIILLIFSASLLFISCKSKVEKKDRTLEEMQSQKSGNYTPVLASADTVVLFKTIDTVKLHLNIFYPDSISPDTLLPCMIFFFPGGFIHGSPDMFEDQAKYFASKGLITVCADYRVIARNKITAIECLKDGNSAMRWLRQYGTGLQIDTNKIIASGGSAGGVLCILTALDNPIGDDASDDLSFSPKPNYMVLFNPVINLEEFEFRIRKFNGQAEALNPYHALNIAMPPTIIMHGTDDELAGYFYAKKWVESMQQLGSDAELITYEGQKHGFYQRNNADGFYYNATLTEAENWLRKHGLIK